MDKKQDSFIKSSSNELSWSEPGKGRKLYPMRHYLLKQDNLLITPFNTRKLKKKKIIRKKKKKIIN